MISPLKNFAVVQEDKLFRSAQPMYMYEYQWIVKKLKIKTIVNLRAELNHDEKFCEELSINEVTYSIEDHHAPTIQDCLDFMALLDTACYPLLFHCQHGQGRTSTFSVLCSLHEGLTLDQALEREANDFDFTFRHPNQLAFLKEFVNILSK